MANSMGLHLAMKMSQQLVMTPQLQQAIKLLQLSRMDLVDAVRGELMDNPMLEEVSEIAATEARMDTPQDIKRAEAADQAPEVTGEVDKRDQIDWEAYVENYAAPLPGTGTQRLRDDDLPPIEATLTRTESLFDHLMWQLRVSDFTEQEERVAIALIGNINEDGYISGNDVVQVAEELDQDPEYVEEVLEMIQQFDPVGAGARTLKECLLIQARHLELGAVVEDVIEHHLENIEKKNYAAIARALGHDLEEVVETAKIISQLEPRPGRPFSDDEARYITPDIYIRKIDGEYQAVLNDDGMPRLKISKFYREALAGNSSSEIRKYVTEKLNSAQWLIRSIHQRQRTIVKVAESIIKFQREFLDSGVQHLKPLILRDVAEDIGMHESTVSRVTTNKYVHTPQGIYELKFFFNSSIRGDDGDLASEAVKSKIRALVSHEDAAKPYSDQRIVELLKEDGVDIARRTVAKYREAMGILPSSKRRRLF